MDDGIEKVYFSCSQFTVKLEVLKSGKNVVIVDAAPIVSRFRGQRLVNLIKWATDNCWFPVHVQKLGEPGGSIPELKGPIRTDNLPVLYEDDRSGVRLLGPVRD
jgi:hypothetical protein